MSETRDWKDYPIPAWAVVVFLIVLVSVVTWISV